MIRVLLSLVVVGVVLYLVEKKIPMDDTILITIRVIVVVGVCLFLLRLFGVAGVPLVPLY